MKLIVLAIASHSPTYDRFAKIFKAYMNSRPWIKSFLVYGGSGPFRVTEDEIHVPVVESLIPGILHKTLWAMRYVIQNFEFDYLLRTNLSSFWILDRIPPYLEFLPDTMACSSHHMTPLCPNNLGMCDGSGMFFTRDVIVGLCRNETWGWDQPDDREISKRAYMLGCRIYSKHYLLWKAEPGNLNIQENLKVLDNSDTFQVRIRNSWGERNRIQIDPIIQYACYEHFYGNHPKLSPLEEELSRSAIFYKCNIEVDVSEEFRKYIESSLFDEEITITNEIKTNSLIVSSGTIINNVVNPLVM